MTTVSPPLTLAGWQGQRILALLCARALLGHVPVAGGYPAAFAAAAAPIALATTNTHKDTNQADAAEPQADWPLAAAPKPITKEI
jgi:hypothetical protein